MPTSLYARLHRRYGTRRPGLRRREFLELALKGSAGLWLACGLPQPAGRANGQRVAVVGAGLAGLACAYELRSAGYQVTLIEARTRVGGRVLTLRDLVQGKSVEAGGELIGANHPLWNHYAERFALPFRAVTDDASLEDAVILEGKRLTDAQVKKLFQEMESAYLAMTADAAKIDADAPWSSPTAAALDRRSAADWLSKLKVSPRARRAIAADLAGTNGVALEAQSYLGNLAQVKGGGLERYWSESELFRCSDGNDALARKLADAIGPASIRLKTAVMAMYVEEGGVRLRCSDGSALEVEHAVLAVPPSVWRKIAIHPQLPEQLRPQMGVNVKYLAAVKERFWRGRGASANTSSDGMISCTWEATDGQLGPGAALVAFSGGPAAQICRKRWKASQDTAYRAELARLLAKFGEHAEGARFLDWVGDPWCRGGYSFPAPGQVTALGPTLREGVGRLQFAGEHTCYAFVGYMEGALQSGAAAARRIAARDGVRISLERAA